MNNYWVQKQPDNTADTLHGVNSTVLEEKIDAPILAPLLLSNYYCFKHMNWNLTFRVSIITYSNCWQNESNLKDQTLLIFWGTIAVLK